MTGGPRAIAVRCRGRFAGPGGQGLLAADPRARTLRRVLVTYPAVRHVLPERISLAADADARTVAVLVRFLQRQRWLVATVEVEGCTGP